MVNWREPGQRDAGGAEEYAWRVSTGLRDLGAAVHYVTSRERGQRAHDDRDGIRIVRRGGTYSRYPLVAAWLLRHRTDFDVVIDCMNGIPFFSPLVMRGGTRVILLVHHVHSDQFSVYFEALRAAVGRAVEGPVARRLYRRHTAVAISPSTACAMRETLRWQGPIAVIPNGTPPLEAETPCRTGDPSLIYVGRLVIHKRVDLLVEAAATLRVRWPDLALHVVGRGPEHARLAALVRKHGLQGVVHLHGFLPEPDKNALLAGSDLHLTASAFEGWGLSVMEAASLGVPTVAYDLGGLRDVILDGETGWLATPGEALAAPIERALKELADPIRKSTIAGACRTRAATFTWSASVARFAQLITTPPNAPQKPLQIPLRKEIATTPSETTRTPGSTLTTIAAPTFAKRVTPQDPTKPAETSAVTKDATPSRPTKSTEAPAITKGATPHGLTEHVNASDLAKGTAQPGTTERLDTTVAVTESAAQPNTTERLGTTMALAKGTTQRNITETTDGTMALAEDATQPNTTEGMDAAVAVAEGVTQQGITGGLVAAVRAGGSAFVEVAVLSERGEDDRGPVGEV
jgi:glycosyltransferase involved in cell wall biosynthesis